MFVFIITLPLQRFGFLLMSFFRAWSQSWRGQWMAQKQGLRDSGQGRGTVTSGSRMLSGPGSRAEWEISRGRVMGGNCGTSNQMSPAFVSCFIKTITSLYLLESVAKCFIKTVTHVITTHLMIVHLSAFAFPLLGKNCIQTDHGCYWIIHH